MGRFQLPCTLVRIFHKLVKLAEVPDVRLHDLRHTAASLLVRHGVPIKAVAERLGHRDASLTLRVYTHVYEEQRREAALSLDQLLGGHK
ncbi:tyrosine-type recombinase/integrase [Deinococcus metallilatus]|uniref:tyrosine-type recombinase/integrase n=1 Tax=Deinococcus metallilatus TaxID=1211322 RepID=UPI003CC818DB